jgi:hypothetical protein
MALTVTVPLMALAEGPISIINCESLYNSQILNALRTEAGH